MAMIALFLLAAADIEIASRHVAERKPRAALSANRTTQYFVGQEWWVRAFLPLAPRPESSTTTVVHFHFRVTEVARGLTRVEVSRQGLPEASLITIDGAGRVTPATAFGSGLDLFPLNPSMTGEDALGRRLRVDWKPGEPWPRLMHGPAGTAELLKEAP